METKKPKRKRNWGCFIAFVIAVLCFALFVVFMAARDLERAAR
jgi:hypothetical protein